MTTSLLILNPLAWMSAFLLMWSALRQARPWLPLIVAIPFAVYYIVFGMSWREYEWILKASTLLVFWVAMLLPTREAA